jgi:polysaccharide biosynthesis/export protein
MRTPHRSGRTRTTPRSARFQAQKRLELHGSASETDSLPSPGGSEPHFTESLRTSGVVDHGRVRRPLHALCAGIVLALAGSACQSAGGPSLSSIAESINATLEPNAVILGVGDEVEVRFPYQPTWNQVVRVYPDGSASFLGIGRLIVAGMSPGRLGQALGEAYKHVLESPEVDVVVKSFSARSVYVMGEVTNPGALELEPDNRLTFVEALAKAGGPLKQSAYLAHAMLIRWNGNAGQQMAWTIDARIEHWGGSVPLYLQPYDVIFIPNTPVDDVAIWVDNYIRRMIPFPYLIPPFAY